MTLEEFLNRLQASQTVSAFRTRLQALSPWETAEEAKKLSISLPTPWNEVAMRLAGYRIATSPIDPEEKQELLTGLGLSRQQFFPFKEPIATTPKPPTAPKPLDILPPQPPSVGPTPRPGWKEIT